MKNVSLLKEVEKNQILLGMQKNEELFSSKFESAKNEVSALNVLNEELKTSKDKKEISNKFFLSLRKLIRVSILALNNEVLKTTSKEELTKVVINKTASEKQSQTIGVNKLVQLHKKSLGACLSVLDKVFNEVKNEPNKAKEFVSISYRVNKINLNYEEIKTTYKVTFCPILSDVIGYARKNSELYSFISLLFTNEEINKLTERKVLNAINKNLESIQNVKAQIKERVKEARAKK